MHDFWLDGLYYDGTEHQWFIATPLLTWLACSDSLLCKNLAFSYNQGVLLSVRVLTPMQLLKVAMNVLEKIQVYYHDQWSTCTRITQSNDLGIIGWQLYQYSTNYSSSQCSYHWFFSTHRACQIVDKWISCSLRANYLAYRRVDERSCNLWMPLKHRSLHGSTWISKHTA